MRISIPKPCNENWNEMTPQERGAFCKLCSKVVVDFSRMSDEEIVGYLEKRKTEKTCGRFTTSQLSPYELKVNLQSVASTGSFPKIFTTTLFLVFSALFICRSDTGERLSFKVNRANESDTASVTIQIDTIALKIDTADVKSTELLKIQYEMVLGGISVPQEFVNDTIAIKKGTTETFTIQKPICPNPEQPVQNDSLPLNDDGMITGKVMMGELMF